jgi:phage shock protein C
MRGALGSSNRGPELNEPRQRLTRSRERWLGGVCGGIAQFLGWPPLSVRLLYIAVSILSAAFPGILAYIVLWLVMPPAEPPALDIQDYRVQ